MKPNLFDFAAGELAQDAFLAWLMQWSAPENKGYDAALCARAQDFIRLLVGKVFPGQPSEINKVVVGRKGEYKHIDIWAEINDEFLIIIEDKTHTGAQGNQLERYRQLGEELWVQSKPGRKLVCIWLKTGSESRQSLEAIKEKGFCPVERDDLRIFCNQIPLANSIFSDFTEKLNSQFQAEQSYTERLIGDWNWNSWEGFYQFLDSHLEVVGWDYVPNPAGGFLGLWWHSKIWKDCNVYLQITQGDLCFKIAVAEPTNQVAVHSRAVDNQICSNEGGLV